MSETEVQATSSDSAEDEPIYYSPGRLSLIASIASWFSWFVLAGFIIDVIVQGMSIRTQLNSQGLVFTTLLSDTSFLSYLSSNLLTPLFTGIALFLVLQASSIGLNTLLEVDFNQREDKGK